jgi:glutathione S-transferase
VSSSLYFEDQREEAVRAATAFRQERLPKWLAYFEAVINAGGGNGTFGQEISYVDLALFQLVAGLRYAFPHAMDAAMEEAPHLAALAERVARRDGVAAYLASDRRIPFNEHGIFRHYPELDG